MVLAFQTLTVMLVTWLTVLGAGRLARRLGWRGVSLDLGQTVLRLLLVVGIAMVVGIRGGEHRAVLVFAVGAAYFAAVVGMAWHQAARVRGNQARAGKVLETSR